MFEQRQLTGATICNTVDCNMQSSVKFYRTFLAIQKERSAAKHRLSCCFRLSAFLSLKGSKQKQTAQCDNVRIHSHVIIQLQQCGQQCGHGPHATVSVCHQASAGEHPFRLSQHCLKDPTNFLPLAFLFNKHNGTKEIERMDRFTKSPPGRCSEKAVQTGCTMKGVNICKYMCGQLGKYEIQTWDSFEQR